MRTIIVFMVTMLTGLSLAGQNLLGYEDDMIERYVQKNMKELVRENDVKNEHYNYLKYSDSGGTTTVYFFLSEDNKCTRIKRMHVHSLKDQVVEELDSKFERSGEDTWFDKKGKVNAVIKLINEEWYFTVIIEPETKQRTEMWKQQIY